VIEAKDRPVKGSASPFVVAVDMVMDMELDTSSTLLPCVFIWGQSTTGLGSMERVCGLHRRKQKVVHKVASTHVCLSTGWNVILSWFLAPSCRLRTCVSRNFYDFIRRQTVAGWPFHIHTSFGATRLKLKQPHDLAFMGLFGRANCLFDIEHNKFQLN